MTHKGGSEAISPACDLKSVACRADCFGVAAFCFAGGARRVGGAPFWGVSEAGRLACVVQGFDGETHGFASEAKSVACEVRRFGDEGFLFACDAKNFAGDPKSVAGAAWWLACLANGLVGGRVDENRPEVIDVG